MKMILVMIVVFILACATDWIVVDWRIRRYQKSHETECGEEVNL